MSFRDRSKAAFRAALAHFGASLVVALGAAVLVFGVWYPYPYRELAGGTELFLLIMAVDVVCGPLLTLVLFNPKKPKWELRTDLGLVIVIQLAALAYGLYALAMARPVYLVYEIDRFRVVSMADIQPGDLKPESGGLHRLPWTGPEVIGVRRPADAEEKLRSLDLSLQGNEPSARPDWWVSYDQNKEQALARSKPLQVLRDRHPAESDAIYKAVQESGLPEGSLKWVPLTGFKSNAWVVLIDGSKGDVKAFAPVDGF